MLVHYRVPHGVIHLHGYRIYGGSTGMSPTNIPFKMFLTYCYLMEKYNRPLVQATYTSIELKKLFNKNFDEYAFKYREIKRLHPKTIIRLAKDLDIKVRKNLNPNNKKVVDLLRKKIRRKIKRASPLCSIPTEQ